MAATVALILCGALASFAAAAAVAENDTDTSEKAFARSSESVASTLQLAIEHDNDIVADAGGVLVQPNVSQADFVDWAETARVLARYPEVPSIGSVVLVDAADVAAFGKRMVADPPGRVPAGGTGYSSLAYLRRFPVDSLKIDRMFTNAITTSPESTALIATLVQLGKDLGLSTLAEGVETTAEMDLLRNADVNQAQGFLMAHPLDPDTLETRLLAPTRPTNRPSQTVAGVTASPASSD